VLISLLFVLQKNVYSVFRADPASIGFAQLSSLAGGSGERECSLVFPVTSSLLLPLPGAPSGNGSSVPTNSSPAPTHASLAPANASPAPVSASPASTNGSGSKSTSPYICLSISDVSFHCRWRIISQNYIVCHDDHRNHGCPHTVIQRISISLHALNVQVLYSLLLKLC